MREEQEVFSPLYLTQFQCIGAECEDTCCQGWLVYIDPEHYHKIKFSMKGNQVQEASFHEKVELISDLESALQGYGRIRLNEQKQCHFLNKGLCELQQCHGESMLPDVCANYPRNQLFTGKQVHVSGALSCPEIARLCLLSSDSMQLVELKQTVYPIYHTKISATQPSHYERYIDDIRLLCYQLLSLDSYSVRQQLFFIANFSEASKAYFYKTLENDPSDVLQAAIESMYQKEHQETLLASAASWVFSSRLAMKLVLVVLARVEQTTLIKRILQFTTEAQDSLTLEQIYTTYKLREQAIGQLYQPAIERYFTQYCKNYFFGESYTHSDNLVNHTQALLIRVACLRFMFFSHPNVVALLESKCLQDQQAILDSTAVEVFYSFSRLYEHNSALMQELKQQMLEAEDQKALLCELIEF